MPQLPANEQDNRCRNRDVRRHETPPIERMFKSRETLNEQQEETEEQIEAVNPDTAERLERVRRLRDALFL